jgi:hypothetical protein
MNVTVCVDCVAVVLLLRTAGRDSCIWAELRGGFVFCFLAFRSCQMERLGLF